MLRLFLRLLRIKDFEPCKSCETLKQELEFARSEKRELLNSLINLTKPNVVIPQEETKVLANLPTVAGTFSRRKGILEEQHKLKKDVIQNSIHIALPDDVAKDRKPPTQHIKPESVEKLERELGLVDEEGAEKNVGA